MQSRSLAMLAVAITAVAGPAAAQRIDYPRPALPTQSVPTRSMPMQSFPQQSFPQRMAPGVGQIQTVRPVGQAAVQGQRFQGQGFQGQGFQGQGFQGQSFQGQRFQGQRWAGRVDGRWSGGYYAPGGWNAYRRPARGWTLPSYWVAPTFVVTNYASYGLSAPPRGYHWSRYYDDAVLIDDGGRIYDTIGGINWDAGDEAYYEGSYGSDYPVDDRVYASGAGTPPGRPYQGTYQGYQTAEGYQGTYQGQTYGAGYAQPGQTFQGTYQGSYAQPTQQYQGSYRSSDAPPPSVRHDRRHDVVQTRGDVYSGNYAGSYSAGYTGTTIVNGVGYPGYGTTVVTVQTQPVVTTTTTEFIEETVYRAPRKVWRKPVRKWRPAPRQCKCACACR